VGFDRGVQVFIAVCTAIGTYFVLYPPSQNSGTLSGASLMTAAPWWALSLLGLGGVLLLATLFRMFVQRPHTIPTSVRLQFQANRDEPTISDQNNIRRCFAYPIVYAFPPPAGRPGQTLIHKTWAVFVLFEKPVKLQRVVLDGNGTALPLHAVKDQGPLHAVISVGGDLGNTLLDIKVIV
jgi:hypothetical protein